MNTTEYAGKIAKELEDTLSRISAEASERVATGILNAQSIFVAGAGRSGLMMKAFAMRLMHMGVRAYAVGETVTPGISQNDLLIIGSGSGETGSLVGMADKAKKLGAQLALVTIFPDSSIGRAADIVIHIPAPTPKSAAKNTATSIQPMGSLFEQSLLLTLDAIVLRLMDMAGKDSGAMFTRHANLE